MSQLVGGAAASKRWNVIESETLQAIAASAAVGLDDATGRDRRWRGLTQSRIVDRKAGSRRLLGDR